MKRIIMINCVILPWASWDALSTEYFGVDQAWLLQYLDSAEKQIERPKHTLLTLKRIAEREPQLSQLGFDINFLSNQIWQVQETRMCFLRVVSHTELTSSAYISRGVFAVMSLHSSTIKQRKPKRKNNYQLLAQPLKAQDHNWKENKK